MTIHYHSDELLIAHQLLLEQDGDKFRVVDYATLKPASMARYKALEAARRRQDREQDEDESYD